MPVDLSGSRAAAERSPIFWAIFVFALSVRLLGASTGNLMYDEGHHWATAQSIGAGDAGAVWRSVDHPPMSVYVVRLSSILFGDSNAGFRALHVLFGALTVLTVYALARRVFSARAATFAAALLAVDQFHLTWSYFAVPEVLLLFFGSLVLLQYLRAVESDDVKQYLLLGIAIGLSYVAKETTMFLVPVLWLALIVTPQRRYVLRRPHWYLAHAVALVIVLPDLYLNYTFWYEGYFFRNRGLLATSFLPAPRAVVLYLGELTQLISAPLGGYSSNYATQNPAAIHWPAGVVYLVGAATAIRYRRDEGARLMLITYASLMVGFTLLPGDPGTRNNWWWASLSLVPAVVCGGQFLADWVPSGSLLTGRPQARGDGWKRAIVGVLAVYLSVHAVSTALRPGVGVERQSADELVREALAAADVPTTGEELVRTEMRLFRALHVAGGSAGLYAALARTAVARGRLDRARYFVRRSLAFDAENPAALDLQRRIFSPRAE